MTRLVKKYGDPDEPGLVVYLNLHHDLVAMGDNMAAEQLNLNATAPNTDYVPKDVSLSDKSQPHSQLQCLLDLLVEVWLKSLCVASKFHFGLGRADGLVSL